MTLTHNEVFEISRRLKDRLLNGLSRTAWICWWSIWGPISAMILVSKLVRVLLLERSVGALGFIELMRSEILVVLALGIIGYTLLASASAARRFPPQLAIFQLLAALFVLPNMIGHQFYVVTGAEMTWQVFLFGLTYLTDIYRVLESEISQTQLAAIFILQLYFLLGPPYLWWRRNTPKSTTQTVPGTISKSVENMVPGTISDPENTVPGTISDPKNTVPGTISDPENIVPGTISKSAQNIVPGTTQPAHKWLLAGFLGGATLFLLAFLPYNSVGMNHYFAREPLLNLLTGMISGADTRSTAHFPPLFDVSEIELRPRNAPKNQDAQNQNNSQENSPTHEGANSTESGSDAGKKNLVFVILESTRADATTPYNPKLETTPFLAELARDSVLFEQAYAVLPHTSKTLVAIFCGIWPVPTMPIMEARPGALPGKCLPKLLADQGYETAFFQSATQTFEKRQPLLEQIGFGQFLAVESMDVQGFQLANYFGYEDEVMLPSSQAWLEKQQKPFVAAYLTLAAHHDYRPIRRYPARSFHENEEVNRYLNNVHYTDHFLRKLIAQYKEAGLYESTIFVIFADHGEAFGEHGRFQHDSVIYQEGIHIPMLIHLPRQKGQSLQKDQPRQIKPQRLTQRVTQLDLLPTLAELLGFEVLNADLPGESIFDAPESRQIFFSCWYTQHCIGTIDGDLKYIHHYGARADEVFDLSADPKETRNIAAKHTARVDEWREQVLDWKARLFDMHGL